MSNEYLTIFAIMPKEIYKTKELSPEDKLIAERLVYLCRRFSITTYYKFKKIWIYKMCIY